MLKVIKLLFIILLITSFGLTCLLLPYLTVVNYKIASLLAVIMFLLFCWFLDVLIGKGILN